MNIIETINKRHSYRGKYKSDAVPREDLITIMKAGLNAPSGCNKQTTSLIAVDDKDVLKKLHRVISPPVGETAPAMICVLIQRIPAYREKCFAVQDYSTATENMLLAIVELGFGDYDSDGQPDFTIGPYLSSSNSLYQFYTLTANDSFGVLPFQEGSPMAASKDFSIKPEMRQGLLILPVWDSEKGAAVEIRYNWDGEAFARTGP